MTEQLGLALSGGAARGLAHIGVLRVLDREGIRPSYLAGTSMGGLVAAGYAAGRTPDEMELEIIRAGERAMQEAIPALRKLLAESGAKESRWNWRGDLEGQHQRESEA